MFVCQKLGADLINRFAVTSEVKCNITNFILIQDSVCYLAYVICSVLNVSVICLMFRSVFVIVLSDVSKFLRSIFI